MSFLYQYSIGLCISAWCRKAENQHVVNPMQKLSNRSVDESSIQNAIKRRDEALKRKVRYHFLNPWQKLKYRWEENGSTCSIKMSLHLKNLIKIVLHIILFILLTTQVAIFANHSSKLSKFLIRNKEAFEHYFKLTRCNQDIDNLFVLKDVYNQITLITDSFYNVSKQAVGSFRYVERDGSKNNTPPNLTMEIIYYDVGCGRDESKFFPYTNTTLIWHTDLFPRNISSYNDSVNSNDELCCDTEATNSGRCSLQFCNCSVEDQINCYIDETNLDRINKIIFHFSLSTFFRDHIIEDKASVHATFDIQITILNDLYSSMTTNIDLDSHLKRYCGDFKSGVTVLDMVIIIVVLLSAVAYGRSVIKAYLLAKELKIHFLAFHKRKLSWSQRTVLFNKWYIFMLFTNTLILIAICSKIAAEYKGEISIPLLEFVRILLGIGIFCLYCGFFGILSYFETINVLFLTIQLAAPSVIKFAICVIILFFAFAVCGLVVLGPYHPKFEDFSLSLESLYCILNGDDLYTTFELAHLNNQSFAIKIFSELYLVLFVFVFIYAVLSLFIGIYNHTYESLSENWKLYSHGLLRDWAEDKLKNDENDNSYPFPTLPIRKYPNSSRTDGSSVIDETDHHLSSASAQNEQTVPIANGESSAAIELQHVQPTLEVTDRGSNGQHNDYSDEQLFDLFTSSLREVILEDPLLKGDISAARQKLGTEWMFEGSETVENTDATNS